MIQHDILNDLRCVSDPSLLWNIAFASCFLIGTGHFPGKKQANPLYTASVQDWGWQGTANARNHEPGHVPIHRGNDTLGEPRQRNDIWFSLACMCARLNWDAGSSYKWHTFEVLKFQGKKGGLYCGGCTVDLRLGVRVRQPSEPEVAQGLAELKRGKKQDTSRC